MGLGAVVVVGAKDQWLVRDRVRGSDADADNHSLLACPLECIEVAGRSVVERVVERYAALDIDAISVLVESGVFLPPFRAVPKNVRVEFASDLGLAVSEKISDYSQSGIDHAFVHWASVYVETDLLDLFCFHREARQTATSTYDQDAFLPLWVVDCAKAEDAHLEHLLSDATRTGHARYFIREYVNRASHPRDLRQFASDMLRGRCQSGPSGHEAKPGIWLDERAEIHRRARLVAPVYVGCDSKVRADALVTRFSSIERDCCIDCGTVVEDTSVLANTTIGIWLDLCHAVANGNMLLNLEREVLIEITDPSVLRSTAAVRKVPTQTEHAEAPEKVSKLKEDQMPEGWQFGNIFIQE